MNARPNHDAVIDIVAREMTEYEVSRDFRTRVIGRLDAQSHAWRPMLGWGRTAAVIVAAGALIAVLRSPDAPVSSQPVAISSPVGAPSDRTLAAVTASGSQARTAPAERTARAARRVAPPSADELAWLARAVPPLPDVPDLAIDPIQPETLSIAPIVVTPLVTEPLGGRHPES